MRILLFFAFLLANLSLFSQVEDLPNIDTSAIESIITTDAALFEAIWDFDMIDKGNQEAFKSVERFRLVYDSIESELMEIFLTDLDGKVIGTFLNGKPEVTGALANFSFSTSTLEKGIYYLNVVADGKPREAVRVVVD